MDSNFSFALETRIRPGPRSLRAERATTLFKLAAERSREANGGTRRFLDATNTFGEDVDGPCAPPNHFSFCCPGPGVSRLRACVRPSVRSRPFTRDRSTPLGFPRSLRSAAERMTRPLWLVLPPIPIYVFRRPYASFEGGFQRSGAERCFYLVSLARILPQSVVNLGRTRRCFVPSPLPD